MNPMNIIFYLSAFIAIFSTIMVVFKENAVHALLYLILSLLAMAVIFFTMGAPFAGTLEVIVYAGAIMVLFVFVVMLLNIGPGSDELGDGQNGKSENKISWPLPFILAGILIAEFIYLFFSHNSRIISAITVISPKAVAISLFGKYQIGIELASFLLLAGLVGAYHVGRRLDFDKEKKN